MSEASEGKTFKLVRVRPTPSGHGLILTGLADGTLTEHTVKMPAYLWRKLIKPAMEGQAVIDGNTWVIRRFNMRQKLATAAKNLFHLHQQRKGV